MSAFTQDTSIVHVATSVVSWCTYINMNPLQNKNEPNILTAKDVFSLIIVFFIINRYKIFWI
jgi:hypothetical protein